MIDTLREKMNECLRIYEDKVDLSQEMERSEWIKKFNSQLIITVGQFLWTRECTRAILDKNNPRGALADYSELLDENMNDLRLMLLDRKLPGYIRRRVISIITGEIHNKDVVDELILNNVNSVNDFNWKKQLR